MCTVILSWEPAARTPLLVLAVRDEVLDRPWLPPARHWPRLRLVGGLDRLSGGTWLAADPDTGRVACVLNGSGREPDPALRHSRGDLPLAAATGAPPPADLSRYSPFHLVTFPPGEAARLASWDGLRLVESTLPTGVTVVSNTGADLADPRTAALTAQLTAAPRPDPRPGDAPADAWASWLRPLAAQRVAPPADQHAIFRRGTVEGRVAYGSNSLTLLAVAPGQLRYDFTALGDPPWPPLGLTTVLG
ncbi:NRDE family protein [Catellatospora tritici]|uniref:NRDE family protein n=1 Tax=Catellatospora tritici TaxID=2851566 RepID=UPI001C2D395C|nr:NRDE family protein [Catellatospora tritici]MBV1850148.1 NRDE family protein [Catellatospora tritici]